MPANLHQLFAFKAGSGWDQYFIGLFALLLFCSIPILLRFFSEALSKKAKSIFGSKSIRGGLPIPTALQKKGERFLFGFTKSVACVLGFLGFVFLMIPVVVVFHFIKDPDPKLQQIGNLSFMILVAVTILGVGALFYANKKGSLVQSWKEVLK